MLIVVGVAAYYEAMRMIAIGLVRYLGVSQSDHARIRRLMWVPYFAAIIIEVVAGLRNPLGIALVFESALPATAGANCALLFLIYYAPKSTVPGPDHQPVQRSYAWIAIATLPAMSSSSSWSSVLEFRFNDKRYDGSTMPVACMTIELRIEHAQSLKDRRQVVRSLKEKLGHGFNISVAEMDEAITWQSATIGVAAISGSRDYLAGLMRQVEDADEPHR